MTKLALEAALDIEQVAAEVVVAADDPAEELDGGARRNFVNGAMEMTEGFAGVFVGTDEQGYQYVLGSRNQDIQEAGKKLNVRFQGKGGGRPPMIQGSLNGTEQEIREFIK